MQDDWALCVGIGAYTTVAGLDSLPGSLNDAQAIYEWIVDPLGGAVERERAKLLISPLGVQAQDNQPPTPIAYEIDLFLRNIFGDAEDLRLAGQPRFRRLWLYFSGHGIGFPDDEDAGILTADANPRRRNYSNIAGKAWAEIFRVSKAFEEVVLFMDCCRHETTRTSRGGPQGLRSYVADPKGKMVAAFAAAPSRSAFEVNMPNGTPRGKFTIELEDLLKNPPSTPMSAREFMDQLERRAPFIDPFPPRGIRDDFELLPPSDRPVEHEDASLLIAHGESTEELARELAAAMRTPSRAADVMWAPNVITDTPSSFTNVKELVVTRDMDSLEIENLIKKVNPDRTVIYTIENPQLTHLNGVEHIFRDDDSTQAIQEKVTQLQAALSESSGKLAVSAMEVLAKIRIWNSDGRTVATGFGQIDEFDVPPGKYLLRASIGPHYDEKEVGVRPGQSLLAKLTVISSGLPSPDTLVEWRSVNPTDVTNRSVYEINIDDTTLFLSAPEMAGWKLEAFLPDPQHARNILLRLVPDTHSAGAPHPADHLRESLRLALAERTWDASGITPEMVSSDPICSLLAATLRLKCGQSYEEFLPAVSGLLGEEDPDVMLLRGASKLAIPPLVHFLWHYRNHRNELDVSEDSLADGERVVRCQFQAQPWFAWTAESKELRNGWLFDAANVLWPGWSVEPAPDFALSSISDAQASLGAPAASIKRAAYKSPPVDRLTQHEKIAFIGNCNDQLPAAIALAFVERNKKKWESLDVWFQEDDALIQVDSDGRSPEELLAVRDLAQSRILELLKVVAEKWSIKRYQKLMVEYPTDEGTIPVWCFASMWDWKKKGGLVHASPYKAGQNVRTTDFQNLVWVDEEPPALYKATWDTYKDLLAVEVLASSD